MNKTLIFGSTAVRHWFPDFPREPADLDIMSQSGFMEKQEQHYWWPTFAEIIEINKDDKYVDPDLLYTIKCAHSKWNIWWHKTMVDILFLKRKGAKLNVDIYQKLVKDFTETHGKAWASLKGKDSETFFKDAVTRKFVHDELHEAVAVYDRPLYERILKNPESKSVECSREKFEQLSENDKKLLVQEEVWVTALERYLIPANFKFSKNLAYARSLEKLLTTMSAGTWFCMWMVDNYDILFKNEDWSFIDKFKNKFNYT